MSSRIGWFAAIVVGLAVVYELFFKSHAQAGTISIDANPKSLPSSGGAVTVTGTTTLPAGTNLAVTADGTKVDTFTVDATQAFSQTYTVSPNTTSADEDVKIQVVQA